MLFLLLLSFRTVPSPTDRRQHSGSPVVKSGLGQDSSVGIASRCRLDGPGIEFRWGARCYAPVQTGPGAHPASYKMGTGSFQGVKRLGRGVDHPPPSSAEVKERVEPYLPLWAFVACCSVNFMRSGSNFDSTLERLRVGGGGSHYRSVRYWQTPVD